jgi:hypothetical protein
MHNLSQELPLASTETDPEAEAEASEAK